MKNRKSPGRNPVVRQKVEAYMAKHPNAKAAEIAKAVGCNANYVYSLRNRAKKVISALSSVAEPELKKANELQVGGEHYRSMTVQPWDALSAWLTPEEFRGYQKGVAIAYLARERKKGGTQDIEKAMHHLMKLVEADTEVRA